MLVLRRFFVRFVAVFAKQRGDRDLSDEIESHLQFHIDDNLRRGMSPDGARRQAVLKLGGVEQTKEIYRDRRGLPALETVLQDVRFSARMLRKNPGFTIVAIATLALAIGANTAIFSVAQAAFFRSVKSPDAERLMYISRGYPGFPEGGGNFSYPAYRDVLQQNTSFEDFAAYQRFGSQVLTDGAEPVRIKVNFITPSYLSSQGVKPAIGRLLRLKEDRFGDGDSIIVLSYGFWQRQFAGSPDVIGRTIHALLALFLAALGSFGLLSQSVSGPTRELGIRMALGASPSGLLSMAVREGLILTLVGVFVGLFGALVLSRVITTILFGVQPNDPAVLAGIAALLLAVAAAACIIPARRATRVDPLVVLRYE